MVATHGQLYTERALRRGSELESSLFENGEAISLEQDSVLDRQLTDPCDAYLTPRLVQYTVLAREPSVFSVLCAIGCSSDISPTCTTYPFLIIILK